MSKILEIFGKGITVNTPEVIWAWVNHFIDEQDTSEHARLLTDILEHLSNRELVQADKKLQRYLMSDPECILARMTAASYYLIQNEIEQALQQTQSVYFRQPCNTMALYIMGYCHERLGRIEQAMEFYQDCVKFKSFLQLPRQRMAAIYLKDGRLDKAIHEYEMLTSEHPEDVSSQTLLGYLYLACDKTDQALETFNLAILSHPDNYLSSQDDEIGENYLQFGDYERALEVVRELIEQMGPLPDLIIRMADIYSEWNKDAEAIMCYEHAVRMQPNSLEAAIKLGTHYLRSKRFTLAAEQFNKASEINDEILDAYLGLAIAQNKSGDKNESLQSLYLSSSILQNSVMLFTESALLRFQAIYDDNLSNQHPEDRDIISINDVIKAYQKQIRMHKDHPDLHYKYGILMIGEKNMPVAISSLQNTLNLNPIHYRAQHKLAICYQESNRQDQAINTLSRMQITGSSGLEKYYQVALLFADKHAFSNAIKKFGTIQSTANYENTQMQENLEILLENLGLIDRSDTSWERINEASKCILEVKHVHSVADFY